MKSKIVELTFLFVCGLIAATQVVADYRQTPEKGWFFYETPPSDESEDLVFETPIETPPTEPMVIVGEEPKDPCLSKDTWTDDCGFINPGSDFEFQEKQRDALLVRMVMNPQDSKAVEDFQYYTKWMFDQAAQVANMWYYNRIQNPELDPQATSPVSQFGLRLVGDLEKAKSEDIFNLLKEEGMLVYFTRSDCSFCHEMAPTIHRLQKIQG